MPQTSKRFCYLTKLRWVWNDAVKRDVIGKGLAVPAVDTDLQELSAEQIETRAVHAAKFHENWYSKHPSPRHSLEFEVSSPSQEDLSASLFCSVQELLFLRSRNGEYIITLAANVISCWEVPLDGSEAYCVAQHKAIPETMKFRQVIVNEDPKCGTELAYWMSDEQG